MTQEIETLIKKVAIRDIQIALINAQADGVVVPQIINDIIKKVEFSYDNIN